MPYVLCVLGASVVKIFIRAYRKLMLRKAEASTILRQRGHQFSQEDFILGIEKGEKTSRP